MPPARPSAPPVLQSIVQPGSRVLSAPPRCQAPVRGRLRPGATDPGRPVVQSSAPRAYSAAPSLSAGGSVASRLVVGAFSPSVLLSGARRTGRLSEAGLEAEEVPVASSPG